MPEVTVASLDVRQRKLVENAHLALARGQLDYVLEVCASILQAVPGCLPVRRLQRTAQLQQFKARSRLVAKTVGSVMPFLFGADKNNPARTLANAGRLLAGDPTSVPALRLLATAATGLGLPETAAFAFEAIRELEPGNRANLLALGEAWLAAHRPDEALCIAEEILRTDPADGPAQTLLRHASVAQTVTQGNWEKAGTFREKLRP